MKKMRRTSFELSGKDYTKRYKRKHFPGEEDKFVEELYHVDIGENGTVICKRTTQQNYIKTGWFKNAEYETSMGTFLSVDKGEFGGELIAPNGKVILPMNHIVNMFEFDGKLYAVESFEFIIAQNFAIYEITRDFEAIMLTDWNTYSYMCSGIYNSGDKIYILASGKRRRNKRKRNTSYNTNEDNSALFELSVNGLNIISEFDYFFDWVSDIVVYKNKLYVGMDKIVAVADIETGKVKAYTSISTEAEKNIMVNIKKKKL